MNARLLLTGFVLASTCVATLILRPLGAQAQTSARKPVGPPVEEIARQLDAISARAKEHDLLEPLIGTWTVESMIWTDPPQPNHAGLPPLVSHGTMKSSWILGKRFVKCEGDVGQKDELKSESLMIFGFDTRTKKYTAVGFDTFGTHYLQAAGKYDPETKVISFEGSNTETGQPVPFRWDLVLGEKDRFTLEVLASTQPGKWAKTAETKNSRQGSP